jgi:hypothetical protein
MVNEGLGKILRYNICCMLQDCYNTAQTHEKEKFQELLRDLCSSATDAGTGSPYTEILLEDHR